MTDRAELYKEAVKALRHDARNLLNAVVIMQEHAEKLDDPKSKQFADYLDDKVRAMVRLGERADIIAGIASTENTVHDLYVLVGTVVDQLEAEEGQVTVQLGASEATCDGALTCLALEEVLVNAVQTGSRVTVSFDHDAGALTVADQGPGVPGAALPKLFEPYRGAKRPGGSSLGLPMARLAMRAQSGELDLSTDKDTGTTVRLVLPNA
ncbi:sensor histidine kinase [Parvularcula sp. ZS-1/3]|uniref:histidine kinase n=1 Tax=Parvularcula mediterranea TaxID=2732508 RepID=A0A7Y3W5D4_9PROT|nr:HAMP domain-containing sensor histidine kinase [Parvularcula mediterranea]NNU16403.1 sensor histidine kinase [Parvularcula mediterranea]